MGKSREGHDDLLTLAEVCTQLCVGRSTFNEWRATGRAPRCIKLPNGKIRVRRTDFIRWLETREEAA